MSDGTICFAGINEVPRAEIGLVMVLIVLSAWDTACFRPAFSIFHLPLIRIGTTGSRGKIPKFTKSDVFFHKALADKRR